MSPLASDRWATRLAFPLVILAFLLIAAFSVTGAVQVARGRATVERNVGQLVAMQRQINQVADQGYTPATSVALEPLRQHPSPEVAQAAARVRAPVDAASKAEPVKALSEVVAALRGDNARQSERLGQFIVWLYASVAILLLLGLATLWLLWRLRASARAMMHVAELRMASAQEEHAHRLATLQGLAASTAHEVNNPLTAMVLNLEVLKLRGGLDEATQTAIEANLDGAARIARIVAELRQISSPAPRSEVELGAVIDATLRLLAHRVRPHAEVICEVGERGAVHAEYVGLGQVVSNLVVNAIEAFGDRPAAQNRIVVSTRALDSEWAELAVEDNGPGFDRAAFDRLMTPFVTTKPRGSGLGLYVCRRIIEGFEGRLTLVRKDQGARVELKLRRRVSAAFR